jgi:hypothetical protein
MNKRLKPNMKKNLLVLVSLLTASLTLVACGAGDDSSETTLTASSITWPSVSTKADAVKALGKIADYTSSTPLMVPKFGTIHFANRTTSVNNGTNSVLPYYSLQTTYKADVTDASGAVTTAAKTIIGVYTDSSNVFGVFKSAPGATSTDARTTTIIKDDANGTLKALADASIKTYLAKATYASAFAKYLGNFNDDGSAVTGGTARDATLTKQSYSSTGEGNLTVDITAHYTYDEAITYKWDNYLCVAQKSSDDVTMDWKTQVTTKGFEDEDATAGTIEEGKIVAAYI